MTEIQNLLEADEDSFLPDNSPLIIGGLKDHSFEFSTFGHLIFEFVSDFDIRYSDLKVNYNRLPNIKKMLCHKKHEFHNLGTSIVLRTVPWVVQVQCDPPSKTKPLYQV